MQIRKGICIFIANAELEEHQNMKKDIGHFIKASQIGISLGNSPLYIV
jgi:hypothetical protein